MIDARIERSAKQKPVFWYEIGSQNEFIKIKTGRICGLFRFKRLVNL